MERAELARRLGVEIRVAEARDRVVEERDPAGFMAAFAEAVADGGMVFVADPSWGAAERAQFAALTQSKIENRTEAAQRPTSAKSKMDHGWLCLPTAGTGGAVKLARHDQDTLSAAVRGCAGHFKAGPVNAVGVLPLHHVSGLMAWMRCALTGGRYEPWAWTDMESGRWPEMATGDWFLSLVPTQLHRLLGRPEAEERLRRFRAIFLGGGPAWPDLLDRAAAARLPLAPAYGATETAAMVTALRPSEFLSGRRGAGSALPHARVEINKQGLIKVAAESLFRGYYPRRRPTGPWLTEDLGRFDQYGGLHVLGRRDAIIITGGEKVDPDEVEAVLRATGQFTDVAVVGVPHAGWGQLVTACYPAGTPEPDFAAVERNVAAQLAPAKRPKRYRAVEAWPRTETGKLNRKTLAALASKAGSEPR